MVIECSCNPINILECYNLGMFHIITRVKKEITQSRKIDTKILTLAKLSTIGPWAYTCMSIDTIKIYSTFTFANL